MSDDKFKGNACRMTSSKTMLMSALLFPSQFSPLSPAQESGDARGQSLKMWCLEQHICYCTRFLDYRQFEQLKLLKIPTTSPDLCAKSPTLFLNQCQLLSFNSPPSSPLFTLACFFFARRFRDLTGKVRSRMEIYLPSLNKIRSEEL